MNDHEKYSRSFARKNTDLFVIAGEESKYRAQTERFVYYHIYNI